MKIVVRNLGNSASVRSLAAGMEAARLQLDQPVDVREEDGRIVVEPIRADTYDLAPLVAGISDENRHEAVEMGPRVGRAAW